jgi:hypothetical protein
MAKAGSTPVWSSGLTVRRLAQPPLDDVIVNQTLQATGEGDAGEIDARGPWNEGDGIRMVQAPAKQIATATSSEIIGEIRKAANRRS